MARWFVAAILALLAAAPARAARFRITVDTVAWGDQVLASDGRVVPRRRLVQRLGLLARPDAAEGRWTFSSDLRIGTDAGLDQPGMRPEGVAARTVELPHAFLAGRGLWDGRLDLVLGRGYRWDVADLFALDGVQGTLLGPWHVGAEAYAGLVVRREASYLGYADLDPDGTVETPADTPTAGAGLLLHGVRGLAGRAGWRRAWQGGRIVTDVVQASAQAGPALGVRLWANGRWDLSLERAERAEVGGAWAPVEAWEVEASAARVRPVFELDSIFPWFAGGPSDDLSVAVRGRVSSLQAWARGARRWFSPGDFDPVDGPLPAAAVQPPTADGVGAGLVAGRDRRRGGLTGWRQQGYGGDWVSLMLHGAAGVLGGAVDVDGRLRWTRYDADLLSEARGDALQAMAGAAWLLAEGARLHVAA